jgi:benzoate-CoA ligase
VSPQIESNSRLTFNMSDVLIGRNIRAGRGDRPAIRTPDGGIISYTELATLVNRVGNLLREAGVEPGERVAILLHDGPDFIAVFLGAMKIGAVPVPLNTAVPQQDLRYFVAHSDARAIVAEADIVARLAPLLNAQDLARVRVVFGTGGEAPDDGVIRSYAHALEAASLELATYPSRADEASYWLFSSGTTGKPTAAVHLHRDMLECVPPYAGEIVGITGEDILFSVPRLFFSYGLVNSLYLPLLAGASVLLSPERPDARRVLDLARRHRPTLLFSVPTAYTQLCAVFDERPASTTELRSVRLAVSAGEALSAPLYRRWIERTGIELLDGLGSTEVGDDNGQPVVQAEIPGELWVRSRSTAAYYWDDLDRTRRTFVDGWLRTGDRYRRDADGYYWNLGRTDDVFKVNGQWVSPFEVESCLTEHPGVLECAVVGQQDQAGLVKPFAFVVRRSGANVTAEELQAHVRSRLLRHKFPRWIEFVETLPRTGTGKVQRYLLRDRVNRN